MESQTQIQAQVPDHYSKSGLKLRGWTDKAIELFLPEPDKTVPNPHYKNSAPMKLYLRTRVESIEPSIEFQTFKSKSKPRIEASEKSMRTKMKRLLIRVEKWEIFIQYKSLQDLTLEAVESYNAYRVNRSDEGFDYEPASMNCGREFLQRITVNFLRHRFTAYDRQLVEIKGKVGKREAYALLNQKIYRKIAETYPELENECNRQLEEKLMRELSNV